MASSKAHHATGWAAGIIAAALASKAATSLDYVSCALAVLGGVVGATAPDWLEVAWWTRKRKLWITHRTLTHWGLGWAALFALCWHYLGRHPAVPFALGFACGGIIHLLADWPNPMGVPWIAGRHSLKLWTSGHCDLIVVGAAWIAAFYVADGVWFHHEYGRLLLHAMRA